MLHDYLQFYIKSVQLSTLRKVVVVFLRWIFGRVDGWTSYLTTAKTAPGLRWKKPRKPREIAIFRFGNNPNRGWYSKRVDEASTTAKSARYFDFFISVFLVACMVTCHQGRAVVIYGRQRNRTQKINANIDKKIMVCFRQRKARK